MRGLTVEQKIAAARQARDSAANAYHEIGSPWLYRKWQEAEKKYSDLLNEGLKQLKHQRREQQSSLFK